MPVKNQVSDTLEGIFQAESLSTFISANEQSSLVVFPLSIDGISADAI